MSDQPEAEVIARLAREGTAPNNVREGTLYMVPDGSGGLQVIDTDDYGDSPRRATAARQVSSAESFVAYLDKHGLDKQTEIYADAKNNSVIAIIDSHAGAESDPGWQGHRVKLVLEHTKSWLAWTQHDGQWFNQVEFAEFIEQHATDVTKPSSGDLMALAQNFYMTKSLEYESSERLADGQTQLLYKEKVESKGLGKLEVPKELELVLQPYIASPRQFAFASFRTRLVGSQLQIGYVLIRPEEILDGIFVDIVNEIRDGRDAVDDKGITAYEGVGGRFPIYFGRP